MRTLLVLLTLLLAAQPAAAQSTKQLADDLIRAITAQQNEDGTYGGDLDDTCRVLDLLGRSPRRYNELDGPFFRRAAEHVAAAPTGEIDEAWRVLALTSAVTSRMTTSRAAALERLVAAPADDRATLLALRTFHPEALPSVTATDPARAVLLVADPAETPEPPADDPVVWARWARGARLRGVTPEQRPAPPPPRPDLALAALMNDLELVIALHGLPDPDAAVAPPDAAPPAYVTGRQTLDEALQRSARWLELHQVDGTFGLELPGWSGPEPGITAMCLSAAIWVHDRLGGPRPEWIDAGLDYLLALQRDNGAIYDYGVAVYTTSVAIEALLDGGRPEDAPAIARARDYLVVAQADEGEGYESSVDPHYGGIGYGGDERPDLSNTQMALEAIVRAGLPQDHPMYEKIMIFLERTQNLGELGSEEWPRAQGGVLVRGTDGGATYMPGNSPAGEERLGEGVYSARSYGSMTYALTKSYLLAGVPLNDARVDAAIDWLIDNFTLETNPGFVDPGHAADGLYYYYLALARTLSRIPDERLRAADDERLDWRHQLTEHLLSRQRIDGSWVNEQSPRWYEGAPALCTADALLALAAASRTDS